MEQIFCCDSRFFTDIQFSNFDIQISRQKFELSTFRICTKKYFDHQIPLGHHQSLYFTRTDKDSHCNMHKFVMVTLYSFTDSQFKQSFAPKLNNFYNFKIAKGVWCPVQSSTCSCSIIKTEKYNLLKAELDETYQKVFLCTTVVKISLYCNAHFNSILTIGALRAVISYAFVNHELH